MKRKLYFQTVEYAYQQPKLKARGDDCDYYIIENDGKMELHQQTHNYSVLLYRGGDFNYLKALAKAIEKNEQTA
jgi:hypothetical protein